MTKPQSKLLLISGTGDSPKLAENIYHELRDTYQIGDSVNILIPKKPTEVEKSLRKGHTYPPVLGSFPDCETRVDIGKNEFLDEVRGKHIVIVKYMDTPKRHPDMHINDHLFEVLGMLDVFKATDTLRITLAAPYLPYLRSHSIEKYEKQGFYQFDSLATMIEFLSKKGLNNIICINPHSLKIIDKAKEYNITVHGIDSFQSSSSINPHKLGLNSTTKDVLANLQPFLEYFNSIKKIINLFLFH